MNIEGDGILDGKFLIKSGQGISQAIAGELGLSEKDCKELGSVWNDIIEIAENEDSFTSSSKKYSKGEVLNVDDSFEFTASAWNQIVEKVNKSLSKSIEKLGGGDSDGEQTGDASQAGGTKKSGAAKEEDKAKAKNANPEEITEDQLPSVLLRNTGVLTGTMLCQAIMDPAYRKSLAKPLSCLTPKQRAAFNKACREYDAAKANASKVWKNVKDGYKGRKAAKSTLKIIKNLDKEAKNADWEKAAKDAKQKVTNAQNKVKAEQAKLQKNKRYQNNQTKLKDVNQQIDKLEKQKKANKSGKLSPKNQAKLDNLKKQKNVYETRKAGYEQKLNDAKSELRSARREQKNVGAQGKIQSANKNVQKAQKEADLAKKNLTSSQEFKDLNKVKRQIRALESKSSLTDAEAKQLKELKKQKINLEAKVKKLGKPYTEAQAKLKAAKAELNTVKKYAADAKGTRAAAHKALKSGNGRIRINLKKLPKSSAQVLRKAMNLSRAGMKIARVATKGAVIATAAISVYDIYDAYQTGGTKKAVRRGAKTATSVAGAWAGAKAGAAVGAGIGTFVGGPFGTAIGGAVGGVVGGIGGWFAGEQVYDAAERAAMPEATPLDGETPDMVELEMSDEELDKLLDEHPEYADALE